MMTIDNSASFTEASFSPNDLIIQMAELEVKIRYIKVSFDHNENK